MLIEIKYMIYGQRKKCIQDVEKVYDSAQELRDLIINQIMFIQKQDHFGPNQDEIKKHQNDIAFLD